MSDLLDSDLERVTAGKDVRDQALSTMQAVEVAARDLGAAGRNADREITRLGKVFN